MNLLGTTGILEHQGMNSAASVAHPHHPAQSGGTSPRGHMAIAHHNHLRSPTKPVVIHHLKLLLLLLQAEPLLALPLHTRRTHCIPVAPHHRPQDPVILLLLLLLVVGLDPITHQGCRFIISRHHLDCHPPQLWIIATITICHRPLLVYSARPYRITPTSIVHRHYK